MDPSGAVSVSPGFAQIPDVFEGRADPSIQKFVALVEVAALNVRILTRLSWLNASSLTAVH